MCVCDMYMYMCVQSALYLPVADKKTAIGVVEGNIDEAKELVSNEW